VIEKYGVKIRSVQFDKDQMKNILQHCLCCYTVFNLIMGCSTFVELVSWSVMLIECVMNGRMSSGSIATCLMQRRNQLQPDGNLVTPVVSLQMGVLLLLLFSFREKFIKR
jgi:hypothetical protein